MTRGGNVLTRDPTAEAVALWVSSSSDRVILSDAKQSRTAKQCRAKRRQDLGRTPSKITHGDNVLARHRLARCHLERKPSRVRLESKPAGRKVVYRRADLGRDVCFGCRVFESRDNLYTREILNALKRIQPCASLGFRLRAIALRSR